MRESCELFGRELGKKEREIATMLAAHMSYKQIARMRGVSLRTIQAHAITVYKKLGVHTKHELSLKLAPVTREQLPLPTMEPMSVRRTASDEAIIDLGPASMTLRSAQAIEMAKRVLALYAADS